MHVHACGRWRPAPGRAHVRLVGGEPVREDGGRCTRREGGLACSRLPAGGGLRAWRACVRYWPGRPAHEILHVHGREGFSRGCACVATLGCAGLSGRERAAAASQVHPPEGGEHCGGRGLAPINPGSLLGRFSILRGCPLWYDDRLRRALWERTRGCGIMGGTRRVAATGGRRHERGKGGVPRNPCRLYCPSCNPGASNATATGR